MYKLLSIGLAAAAIIASPAAATEYVFTTTGNSAVNGTYGNARTYSSTVGGNTINLQATAWQMNQSTGAVTNAFLGAWSAGLGVTGASDNYGNGGFHQVDNMGGYTDFILLQFSQAVTLEAIGLNSFSMTGQSSLDHDFATYALSLPAAPWNSAINLASAGLSSSDWLQVMTNGASGSFATGNGAASSMWLVAAGPNSYNNDGFKMNAVTVESAVPEPGTWAMMLLGFGAVGFAVRRSRKPVLATA